MKKATNTQIIKIAQRFNELVRHYVGEAKWRKIVTDNEPRMFSDVCATHDYCDANVFMDQAIKDVLKIRCRNINDDGFIATWSSAWSVAMTLQQLPDNPPAMTTPRVIIEVLGGVVSAVHSDREISYDVLDHDNPPSRASRIINKEIANLPCAS